MTKIVLDAEQEAAVQQMVNSPSSSALNASEIGTGKTVMTVETILRLNAKIVLIICPLGTRVGWERTLRNQGWTLPISRITSSKEGKQAYENLLFYAPGAYLVGREYFRKLDWTKIKPDFAVYDECHGFQNRKSVAYRKMRTLEAKYRMALSGTFFGNKFEGAYTVCRWLFPEIVGASFWRWAQQWTIVETDYFGGKAVQSVRGEKVPGEFVKTLPCYVRLESKLTTEVVEETRYVELTPAQRRMYDQIQNDMLTWLEDEPLVVELPLTMRIRLRQATLGTLSLDPETGEILFDDDCKSSKIDALKEILSDLDDEPVLILTDSLRFARVVVKRLGDKAAAWTGDTSHEARDTLLKTFGRKGGPQYLVATIAALGEGVDSLQQVCSTVVWLSRSENNLMNQQVLGRLHRRGQDKNVRSIDIVAVDTYDEGILNTLLQTELNNRASMHKEVSVA